MPDKKEDDTDLPFEGAAARGRRWAFGAAAGVVYVTGVVGFLSYGRNHGGMTLQDALYFGIQLFTLGPPQLEHPLNLAIEFGRWGALSLTSLALLALARRAFHLEWAHLRFRRVRGHVLITGPGSDAVRIARAILKRDASSRLAIWSPLAAAPSDCQWALVLHGETDAVLRQARVVHAAEVVVVGSDDALNVATAGAIANCARSRDAALAPLLINVQVTSITLRESLRTLTVVPNHIGSYVRAFDPLEDALRILYSRTLPLDGAGIEPSSNTQVQLVVIGDDADAVTATVAAARLGHFANGKRLLSIAVVPDESAWRNRLNRRYPALASVVDASVVTGSLADLSTQRAVEALAQKALTRTVIVVSANDDAGALEQATSLLPALNGSRAEVAVRLRSGSLASLLVERGSASGVRFVPYGWMDEQTWGNLLSDSEREQMAKLVHLRFQSLAPGPTRRAAIDEAMNDWRSMLQEDYKESCRLQVDHIWLKLRAVGCELAPWGDPRPEVDWSAVDLDALSRMEHSRWMAERLLSGWTYAPGQKNEQRRTSPSLLPWNKLSESVKRYDYAAVENIPDLVNFSGAFKVCRIKSVANSVEQS